MCTCTVHDVPDGRMTYLPHIVTYVFVLPERNFSAQEFLAKIKTTCYGLISSQVSVSLHHVGITLRFDSNEHLPKYRSVCLEAHSGPPKSDPTVKRCRRKKTIQQLTSENGLTANDFLRRRLTTAIPFKHFSSRKNTENHRYNT